MNTQSKPKKVKEIKAFGILNRLGDFWTSNTFQSEQDAINHIEKFWQGTNLTNLEQFKVIEVLITQINKINKK